MYRKILTAGWLALLAATALADEPAPHPVWSRLEAYRSYFTLGESTPLRHRFTVWFTARGYARADVGADTPEEIDAFTREDLPLSSGAFALPPGDLPPVPEPFEEHEASLRAKVLELFPEAVDVQVRYEGRFRTLRAQELLPFSTGEGDRLRLGSRSWLHLAAEEGSTELRAFGATQMVGGLGRLVPVRDPDVLPDFVDFHLPPALAGTSPLGASPWRSRPATASAWTCATP